MTRDERVPLIAQMAATIYAADLAMCRHNQSVMPLGEEACARIARRILNDAIRAAHDDKA